jgi:hypothetical protein
MDLTANIIEKRLRYYYTIVSNDRETSNQLNEGKNSSTRLNSFTRLNNTEQL